MSFNYRLIRIVPDKKVRFSILFIVLMFNTGRLLFAQSFPNYQERDSLFNRDSLNVQNFISTASDGSINPDDYIVGPGDRLLISISGIHEADYSLLINQEGSIIIPKIGIIDLNNISLTSAKEKIRSEINKYFKNVDIFISLIELKKIKVSLLGDVFKASTFILPGNARLIDLIGSSQGLRKSSDFRNIEILHINGSKKKYDLLSFLRFADKNDNPVLQEGDAVIVDKVDKIVSVEGEVKYPGIYEYVSGESAENLIKIAGGFLSEAKIDTIEIVRFDKQGLNQMSFYYSNDDLISKNILLENNDQIFVRRLPNHNIYKYVELRGWIKYPGFYKIDEGKSTLKEIVNEAGGFLKDASLEDASLIRTMGTVEYDPEFERIKQIPRKDMTDDEYDYFKAKSRQRTGRVDVNFIDLFRKNDESDDIILKKGDVIEVPEAKNYITLIGQVVNPGNIIFDKKLTVKDYIRLAGGFGWRAKENDVRIVRANTGEWLYASDAVSLNPGDEIWVPENPPGPKFWEVFTTSLQVVGEVASVIAATVAVIVATRK